MTLEDVVANVLAGEHGAISFGKRWRSSRARLMEAEVSDEISAARGEVSVERTTHRNGNPPRL